MLLSGKNESVELSPETVTALQSKFPTRDVPAELAKMHLWLLRYPKRRPANIWRFVDTWLKRAPEVRKPPTVVNAWWTTEQRTLNQGAAIGIQPRPGETMAEFRDRVADKMRAA